MIRKLAYFLLFISAAGSAAAQTTSPKTKRPDIPGTFVAEFGFNRDMTGPDNFSLRFWGSRTVNIYYQYDVRILKSRFSFVPGIGLSLERFSFKKGRTLAYYTPQSKSYDFVNHTNDSLRLALPSQLGIDIQKSQLATNYLEIPLEIKYSSKPEDPSRTFKASVGFRVGYMIDSFTKIRYKANGQTIKLKNKQDWNLNEFRYGLSAKIGLGNFSLFGYYNLTNLFESEQGPYFKSDPKRAFNLGDRDDFPTMTVGISLSSF
jgi:hypothetical protein